MHSKESSTLSSKQASKQRTFSFPRRTEISPKSCPIALKLKVRSKSWSRFKKTWSRFKKTLSRFKKTWTKSSWICSKSSWICSKSSWIWSKSSWICSKSTQIRGNITNWASFWELSERFQNMSLWFWARQAPGSLRLAALRFERVLWIDVLHPPRWADSRHPWDPGASQGPGDSSNSQILAQQGMLHPPPWLHPKPINIRRNTKHYHPRIEGSCQSNHLKITIKRATPSQPSNLVQLLPISCETWITFYMSSYGKMKSWLYGRCTQIGVILFVMTWEYQKTKKNTYSIL